MPLNNLNEHIKWLLSEKPFIPPATPLAGYDPQAPITHTTLSQPILDPEAEENHAPVSISTRRITQPPPSSRPPQPALSEGRVATTESVSEMARLRATPGSGRPRLVLAGISSDDTASSVTANRLQRRDAHTDDDVRRHPPSSSRRERTSIPAAKVSSSRKQLLAEATIDSIDLTGDDDALHSPSSRRIKKGQKRKSDEHEEDIQPRKIPRPVRTTPAISHEDLEETMADIDDFIGPPSDPPPPYSTAAAGVQEQSHHIEWDDHEIDTGMLGDEDYGVMQAHDQEEHITKPTHRSSPAHRKRKSLSRVPSENVAPPRKIGKQTQRVSPSKATRNGMAEVHIGENSSRTPAKKKTREVVLDSEEDEFDNLVDDDFVQESSWKAAGSPSPNPKRSQRTPNRSSPSYTPMPASLPIRSPAKVLKEPSPMRLKQEASPYPPMVVEESKPSPNKTNSTPTNSNQSASTPAITLSKKARKIVRQIVEVFCENEGHRLQQRLDVACANWDQAKAKLSAYMSEYGGPGPQELEEVQQARIKKDAVAQLVALKPKFDDLNAKHKHIKARIDADLEAGEFDQLVANGEASKKIFDLMETVQSQIYHLFEPAGYQGYRRTLPPNETDDEQRVVVKSTQTSPIADHKQPRQCHGPDHVPQTQYVKQTDISVREVWTPDKHIRFATHPAVTSPPRQLHLSPTSRIGTGMRKAKQEERPHRIPETPLRRRSPEVRKQLQADREPSHIEHYHAAEESQDEFDVDENLFSTNMGSPLIPVHGEENFCGDEEEDFCGDEDVDWDENLLNVHDWKGEPVQPSRAKASREVLRESSANRTILSKPKSSPKKSTSNAVGMHHQWSEEVKFVLRNKFHIRGFRPGQLEAVNATLGGEHCFVLMPTGGGKSLCYQLPSVIRSGRTRGVTIVVSPLLSLMEDQVQACKQRFDMQAYLINGETTREEKEHIMSGLRENEPQNFIQLLYVTPEMLSKNQRMVELLQGLHRRNQLARIVIDEAHCVSQWGHDFRPDYKALGDVIRLFSGVPILALTATATQLVQTDVVANLGIQGCRKFSQSFNRPNLTYEVRPKGRGIDNIAELIKTSHKGQSGIVYCLARKTCEQVAEKLSDLGIKAHHYHAGMEPAERSAIQRKWQNNTYHVIVATIAFGMGIDKADVRYVVHHSLPKSLEGYYQETGRAGRDGKRSNCYLYYQYSDSIILKKMIEEGDGERATKQRQYDMLRNVIQFCENKDDCRRVQVLSYFSESFKPENCRKTCDNCKSDETYEEKDLTEYAKAAIKLVSQVEHDNVTMLQCVDAFRGANTKLKDVEGYGFGADLDRGDVERLFHLLAEDNAIRQWSKTNKMGFANSYIQLGTRSNAYLKAGKRLKLRVRVSPGPVTKKKATKQKPSDGHGDFPSTNIPSPMPKRHISDYTFKHSEENEDEDNDHRYGGKPHRRKNATHKPSGRRVVPDDSEDEDNEDAFDPVPVKKPSKSSRQRELGQPITIDERIAGLNDVQLSVLQEFLQGAKAIAKDILIKRGLTRQPFSDTILREIGIRLPETEIELLAIPNINPGMVKLYGAKFWPLIRQAREFYMESGAMLPGRQNPNDNAEIYDPNHQNVIEISSSSEDEGCGAENESESDYSCENEEEEEERGPLRVSHHFTQAATDPRVEEFMRRASQLEAERLSKAPARAPPTDMPKPRELPWGSKKGAKRSTSGGLKRGGYTGVSKGRGGKKSGGKRASGGFAKKSGGGRGGGGGGGASGVRAMPT